MDKCLRLHALRISHLRISLQRIMKYPLLIHELRKMTSLTEADRAQLGVAMEAATQLAAYANGGMGQGASSDQLTISTPKQDSFQVRV